MPPNDSDRLPHTMPFPLPDAHGQAALMLVESLIHGLCETGTLDIGTAVDIVDRAISVQRDHADAAGDAAGAMWRAHALLSTIAASLRTDEGRVPPSLHLVG